MLEIYRKLVFGEVSKRLFSVVNIHYNILNYFL